MAIMSWSRRDKLIVVAGLVCWLFEVGVIFSLFMLLITRVSK